MSNLIIFKISILSLLSLLISCSLKMGAPSLGYSQLHLRVKNDSLAPLLGPKVDRELRKNLIRNSTFNLVNEREDADVFLVITLKNYSDYTEAYRPGDTLLAAGLNLRASAHLQLITSIGDTNLHEDVVQADASVLRPESTRVPDDAMALQALAESLAANISLSLLNQAW